MASRLHKWSWRVALGVPLLACLLLGSALGALWVASQTEYGRTQVRDFVVTAANRELPGKIQIRTLVRLDLDELIVDGLTLRDPGGATALSATRVLVTWGQWKAWRSGHVVLPQVQVDGLHVNLADAGTRHGLLAAMPLGTAGTVDDTKPGLVEVFGVQMMQIRNASLVTQLPNGQSLVVSELGGTLSLGLDLSSMQEGVGLNVLALSAQVRLPGQPVLEIVELQGNWAGCPGGELRLSSGLVLERANFQLQLSAKVPKGGELEQAAFTVDLNTPGFPAQLLQGLSQEPLIDDLTGPDFASARGDVAVSAKARGTLENFTIQGQVKSRAGQLVMEGARAGPDMRGHIKLDGLKLDGGLRVPLAQALHVEASTLAGDLSADGRVNWTGGQLHTSAKIRVGGLSVAGVQVQSVRGQLTGSGSWPDPHMKLSLHARKTRFEGNTADDLRASLVGSPSRSQLQVGIKSKASGLNAKLRARIALANKGPWARRFARAWVHGELHAKGLDAAWMAKRVHFDALPSLEGTLQGGARFEGTRNRPKVSVTVGAHLRLQPSRPWIDVNSTMELSGATVTGTGRLRDPVGLWAKWSGTVHRPERGWLANGGAAAAGYRAKVSMRTRSLAQLPLDATSGMPWMNKIQDLRYGIQASVEHAIGEEPSVQISVHTRLPSGFMAKHGAVAPSSCGRGLMHGALAAGLELELSEGALLTHLAITRDGAKALNARASATLKVAPWLAGKGEIELTEDRFSAALEETGLSDLPAVCRYAQGVATGTLSGSGVLRKAPKIAGELKLAKAVLAGARVGAIDLKSTIANGRWSARAQMQHAVGRGGSARANRGAKSSQLSIDAPWAFFGESPGLGWQGQSKVELELNQFPVAMLAVPGGALSQVSGDISARVAATGPLLNPTLSGWLAPRKVGFTWTALAQPIRGLSGRLRVEGDHIAITKLRAEDGQGWVEVGGEVRLPTRFADVAGVSDDGAEVQAELTVRAGDFPLRSQGQVVGTLNTKANVQAELRKTGSRVRVKLNKTTAFLVGGEHRTGMSLEPHADIRDPRVPHRAGTKLGQAPSRSIRLHLVTKAPLWVRRDDFAVLLQADIVADNMAAQASIADGGGLDVRGIVQMLRGYMDLLGVTFDVDAESKIEFVGSGGVNPALSISAQHQNRRTGAIVKVRISGRANDPQLTFFVDGASVSVGDAAMAILGNDPAAEAENTQEQAQSFVAGVVAGLMAVSARRELGEAVPILMVDTEQGGRAGRIRAGFDLDSWVPSFLRDVLRGVYVEGVMSKGAQTSCNTESEQGGAQAQDCAGTGAGVQGGVLIELFWPHNLVSSGKYGPGESWSLDLNWSP